MPSHRIHTIHGTFSDAGNSSKPSNHGGQLFDIPRHQFNGNKGGNRGGRTQPANQYNPSPPPMNINPGPRKRNNFRSTPRTNMPNPTRRAPPPPPARIVPARQTHKENHYFEDRSSKLDHREKLVFNASPVNDDNEVPISPPVVARTQMVSPIELEANEITPVPYIQLRTVAYRTNMVSDKEMLAEQERQRLHRQRVVATVLLTRAYGRPLIYRTRWPGMQKEYVRSGLSKMVEVEA